MATKHNSIMVSNASQGTTTPLSIALHQYIPLATCLHPLDYYSIKQRGSQLPSLRCNLSTWSRAYACHCPPPPVWWCCSCTVGNSAYHSPSFRQATIFHAQVPQPAHWLPQITLTTESSVQRLTCRKDMTRQRHLFPSTQSHKHQAPGQDPVGFHWCIVCCAFCR